MLPDEQSRPVLDSLLEIVKEIANLPECRNPSRRQFSNLVRRIKLLSPLFEELRDGDSLLGESEVGSFVSFTAALESSKSLLREINEGSKLFQALKWEKIANKFDEVTGQLEKALSEIPYDRLDISEEVREQVELVHTQLRRAKARKEKPDVQLFLNLSLAKNVKEVDRTTLHRLSEKLHLRTINDLMRESLALHEMVISGGGETVDFLEEMSTLLKKLKDFVVSENTDGEISDIERLVKHKSPIIPDDFRCPISLELMKDPVIVSTGQTYERSCIEKWLDAGHKTCPKTQQTLSHTALTPNYVLKSLIGQWCDSNGVEVTKRHSNHRNKKPGSCTSDFDRKAIEALMEKLRNGSEDEQRAAAGEIRLLAKRNADNRVCIAEAGAIPLLIELLASPDPRTQEHAVTALLNLSINESNKGSIVNKGAIPDIVEVLKKGSMEARENAAATLFSLSVIDENKVAIGAAGAIPALIDLLSQGSPRGKKDAATAIFNLTIYQGNKVRAVRAGIMVPLMTLLMEPGGGMMDEALAILAILASHPEGKLAIGQAEPIPVLVDVIRTGSPRNRENAAAVLWSLCSGELHNLMVAKENGIEETLKQLMESGTDRAKRKAGNLLELIRQSVEDEGEGEGEGGSEGVQ